MEDGNPSGPGATEDQMAPVDAATNAVMFVTWHDGSGFGHVGDVETTAAEFAHDACRTDRVGARDVVVDRLEISLGRGSWHRIRLPVAQRHRTWA